MIFRSSTLLRSLGALVASGALLMWSGGAGAQGTKKPDAGKFTLSIQENEIGTDAFAYDAEGGSESDMEVALGPNKSKVHQSIKYSHGRLSQIVLTKVGVGRIFTIDIQGDKGTARMEDAKKTTSTFTAPSPPALFGNFSPHLVNTILSAYDLSKGGPQKLNVLLVDGGVTFSLTLTPQGAKTVAVGGRKIPVTRYQMDAPGPIGNIDIEVIADADGRLLLMNIPGQRYVVVREGYKDLLKPEGPVDPTLSQPTFTLKKETAVKIAMRDGVKLAADVYRPDSPGKFPVILQRTPYGRTNAFEAAFYAKRGYVFVAQDVRGKFDSEGAWQPLVNEARDGHDTVEWCASQPWSNGKIGMIGASYLGFVQWAAAREGTEHLKCLIPIVSPPDPFFNIPYAYGAPLLLSGIWWTSIVDGKGMNAIPQLKDLKPFNTLPLGDVDKAVLGHHVAFFQEWLHHPTNDAYRDQVSFNDRMAKMGPLPALHVSGWFDGDGIGTRRNYAAMVKSGHANQKLIYGPWTHAVNTSTKLGDMDFGPQSLRDLDTLYLRWFDHWLKGVNNGVDREPSVDAFLMGVNQWRTFSAWPPKEAKLTKWYFHSKGHANADKSDGLLTPQKPAANETPDRYTYDPAHPFVPTGLEKRLDLNADFKVAVEPSTDPQLLTYTSPVLDHDVIVAGPINVHLSAASSARDTDWAAILGDVQPGGKVIGLCQNILRARFRHSFAKPEWLKPDVPDDYNIDVWAIGNVFKKGHRIRITVTSSLFPIYARNLNTGEDDLTATRMATAQQTILHDGSHLSYVVLPILDH